MIAEDEEVEHPHQRAVTTRIKKAVYDIEDLDLNHTLVFEGLLIFDDFDGNHLFEGLALAFHHLAEGALAKEILDFVLSPLRSYYHVRNSKNVVIFRVIPAVIKDALCRMSQIPLRIHGHRLVVEPRVAQVQGLYQTHSHSEYQIPLRAFHWKVSRSHGGVGAY